MTTLADAVLHTDEVRNELDRIEARRGQLAAAMMAGSKVIQDGRQYPEAFWFTAAWNALGSIAETLEIRERKMGLHCEIIQCDTQGVSQ